MGSSSDTETVYKFMMAANRPFSGNDVFSNLQRQGVGKSAVDKALDQLAKDNKITVKLNGKQKIYCAMQSADSMAKDQKEIQSIDEQLSKISEALRLIEHEYRQSEVEVNTLQSTLSTAGVELRMAEMEKTVSELRMQLDLISRNTEGNVSAKDMEQTKKDYEKSVGEYKKRKRMCTDVLDSILENCPKPKKALFEEIGIETDESVDMPSL